MYVCACACVCVCGCVCACTSLLQPPHGEHNNKRRGMLMAAPLDSNYAMEAKQSQRSPPFKLGFANQNRIHHAYTPCN